MAEKQPTQQSYKTFTSSREELTAEQRMSSSHKTSFVVLIIANVVLLLAVFVLNGLSTTGTGIFVSTQTKQSAKYYLEITPAGWTFSIWGVIYFWEAAWVIYSVVNIFRKTAEGRPVYLSPVMLTPMLFGTYMIANACNLAWLFSFDRSQIEIAFVALLLIAVFLIIGLAISYRSLDKVSHELVSQGRTTDIWLVRGLVHNGLAIYATWTSIATLLNMAMVIAYSSGSDVDQSTACTVALGVLTAEIVVFAFTDLFFLDRYSRYTFTPYMVVVVALVGSLNKNYVAGATNSVFTIVLLAVGGFLLLVKVIVSIYRHVTRAPYPAQISPTLSSYKAGNMA